MTTGIEIRDAAFDILDGLADWQGRVHKRRMIPTRPGEVPCILVHMERESFDALGDGVSGIPDFKVEATLVVSVVMLGSSEPDLDEKLDAAADQVLGALLTDPDFVAAVEGIESVERNFLYPREAELQLAEAKHEIVLRYSVRFNPDIPDNLVTVGISPSGQTEPLGDGVFITLPTPAP